jgi:hypothetical protein
VILSYILNYYSKSCRLNVNITEGFFIVLIIAMGFVPLVYFAFSGSFFLTSAYFLGFVIWESVLIFIVKEHTLIFLPSTVVTAAWNERKENGMEILRACLSLRMGEPFRQHTSYHRAR